MDSGKYGEETALVEMQRNNAGMWYKSLLSLISKGDHVCGYLNT